MVFSSPVFLFVFLPITLIVYFAVARRSLRNVWILIASLVFYAWGEPVYIVLMIASIIANWLFGVIIGAEKSSKTVARIAMVLAVVFNIAVIGFFKYEGFLADTVNGALGRELIPNLELPLPIGISFYTLQALSYVIDVYRKEVLPQRNILYLGMYIVCFPQLIAGPIVRYQTIQDQVLNRRETLADFSEGLRLFIIGLAKKVLLANTVAALATKMLSMGGASIGFVGAWAGLIAYTFQIFFDFSGYSDMAIGLGRMMGFQYLRNFNYPYISKSITEFWRRWHISLSTFFRDYLYIPLGGSRCSTKRNILNIAIVWATTGLWHGAAWNYVGWGVYYGVLLILEKFVWGNALSRMPAIVRHLYTIMIFVFGWSFFWITDPAQLVPYWQAMLFQSGLTGTSTFFELTAWEYVPVFAMCVLASVPLCPLAKEAFLAWVEKREARDVFNEGIVNSRVHETTGLVAFSAVPADKVRHAAYAAVLVVRDLVYLAMLFACCASLVSGSFNPFIYFQF